MHTWTITLYYCSVTSVYFLCADVIMSGIGAIIWTAILTTWITIFQLHRAEWGATADQLSFIIPTGIP